MLFCYQDLIRLASFNTVCLRDPTQMSPESGSGTPLKQLRLIARPSSSSPSWAAMPRNPPPHAAVGTPSTCSSSASYSPLVVLCPMQFCGQASLVDFFFFCRHPRIAQIPLAIFRIRFEPKGACLCGGPSEGDVIVSLRRESPCCQTRPRSPRHGTRSRTSSKLPRAPP